MQGRNHLNSFRPPALTLKVVTGVRHSTVFNPGFDAGTGN